ncbi:MAG: bifunctional oligoribonuclease/PAP phosphatase NrnA [Verrucomicrobiota bacterium]
MSASDPFDSILQGLSEANSILVVSHNRPDGDAIGSSLAMGLMLEKQGKAVRIWNHDEVPDSLAFLSESSRIELPGSDEIAVDAVVCLDSAGKDRIDERVWNAIPEGALVINIDHHVSNTGFGDLNHVDSSAPATGQILFELFKRAGWAMDSVIAAHLYAAISTDTGSFRYPSTTSETMRIGAALIEEGIDAGGINRLLYENYPKRRVEAMRDLLAGMRFDYGDRVSSVRLSLEHSRALGLRLGDTEGIIDVIRAVDSVIVAVFFEELPDEKIRVSSRSKSYEVDVGEICALFGGGGHTLAAGARMRGSLDEAADRFIEAIGDALPPNRLG